MKRIGALMLSIVILCVASFPVSAEKSVGELQSDLSNLNKELQTLEKELDSISSKVKQTSTRLEKTKKELAIAEGQEQAQYESMMLRIKYMYENGNLGTFDLLFTSSCLAELLSRAEYIMQVTNHDRELLETYTLAREEVAAQKEQLQKDQAYLAELEKELDQKEANLKNKISTTSKDLSHYLAQLENTRDEVNDAQSSSKEEVKPVKPSTGNSGNSGNSGSSKPPTTNGAGVSYTSEDVTLLAALIECEAGSRNYEGMLAVGSVVLNRMKHSRFPNTLYGVVYHPGQFPPAHDGKVDRILKRGVKSSCVQAATDALNGKNNIGSCLYFRAASSGRPGVVVGGNVFF